MRRLLVCAVVAALAVSALLLPGSAGSASAPPTGWDGANPFRCVLQQAAFGETGPDPKADPYCVEFDKRRQNITELGLLDFVLKEPGRFATAGDKCFYFQVDHWRGSIVQTDGSTKTYEWDGHYFVNQGTGDGGAWITNFNVNGKTYDPSAIPGVPPEYSQHFGPGTFGGTTRNDIPVVPRCVERLRRESDRIYTSAEAARRGEAPPCVKPTGAIGARRIGALVLGAREGATRTRLGAPRQVKRGFLRYCVTGGGSLLVGETTDRSGETGGGEAAQAVMLVTSSRAHRAYGIGPGSTAVTLHHAFAHAQRRLVIGHTAFWAPSSRSGVLLAVRGGRVRWVAVYDRRALARPSVLRAYLVRSRGL